MYYPALRQEYNDTNPIYDERFYNGRILGMSKYSYDEMNDLNGVMAWFNLEQGNSG